MKLDEFKDACSQISMTPRQKQRLWRHAKAQMEQKSRKRAEIHQLIPLVSLVIGIVLICMAAIPAVLKRRETAVVMLEGETESIQWENAQYAELEQYTNYLILGSDARKKKEADKANADAIFVCSLNEETGAVRILTVPPELLVIKGEDGDEYITKAELVMTGSGMNAMAEMAEEQLGISIDGCVVFSWTGAAQLINELGGLRLEVTEKEVEEGIITGHLTEIVKETGIETDGQITKAGVQWMDGPRVLAWCRVGFADEGGKEGSKGKVRGDRQLTVLKLVFDEVINGSWDLEWMIEVVQTVLETTKTDIALDEIIGLLKQSSGFYLEDTWNLADSGYLEAVASGLASQAETEKTSEEIYGFKITDWVEMRAEISDFLYGRETGSEEDGWEYEVLFRQLWAE